VSRDDATTPEAEMEVEVLLVVGTRPEIIKSAPVIRAIEATPGLRPYLLHTGQHYDTGLSEAFFEALDLSAPDEYLAVGSTSQAEQTAAGLEGIERVITEREPAAALAQGDTNAVLSTALAAAKLPIPFGHVEAGIRSFDRSMPEEINRVLADGVTDLAFAPTEEAVENLAAEGVAGEVFHTGNTVVDACREYAPLAAERSTVLERLDLVGTDYAVATVHRASNTDDLDRLRAIVDALDAASAPVVLPAHPRTTAVLDEIGSEPSGALELIAPLGYLDFLRLLDSARVAVTDSGGVQEEASILEVPCLTVRPNTERPETVRAGVNELLEPDDLAARLDSLLRGDAEQTAMTGSPSLYGDGTAGERIAEIVAERV
jgi:UDP-N-acetylglucosamine 2-epimerase (non-hydrolysing)